jgi:hypothetical protein
VSAVTSGRISGLEPLAQRHQKTAKNGRFWQKETFFGAKKGERRFFLLLIGQQVKNANSLYCASYWKFTE